MPCRYNEYVNLVQYKNYWNNAEKPQQHIVKIHCEKALGNATANCINKIMAKLTKIMQKLCKTHLNLKSPSYTKVKYTLSVFQIYWKCTSKVYLKYTSKVYLKYISSILEAYFKYTSSLY